MAKELNPTENIEKLSDIQRYVTQERGTEAPFTANCCTISVMGCTNVCVVTSRSLSLNQSLILAVVGQASINPLTLIQYAILMIILIICIVSKFVVVIVMPIWGMYSPTDRSLRVNVIA